MKVVLGIDDGRIPVWEILDNDIMVNQLFLKRKVKLPRSLKSRLWVDSGGYQIMVKGLGIGVDEVAKVYRSTEAKFFLSLDYPVGDPAKFNEEIVKRNIQNFVRLMEALPSKKIIPVVHLYPSRYLLEATSIYRSYGVDIIAYGGIVPPLLKKTSLRVKSLIGFLILRKAFPNLRIHVLGAGSFLMTRILKGLGADSVDTSTWRVKAAYGHVIIPGKGERYVGTRKIKFHTPKATEEDLEVLYKELKRTNFPRLRDFEKLLHDFRGRALINAWIIAKGDGGIHPKSPFRNLMNYLQQLAEEPLEQIIREYEVHNNGEQ